MVIKRAFVQFVFLLLLSALMFVFLNNILLRDTRLFSEINKRDNLTLKPASQEMFLEFPNSDMKHTLCNMSSHGLLGKMDVDEGFKNWSAIEDLNPVCFKKYHVYRVTSCIKSRSAYIHNHYIFVSGSVVWRLVRSNHLPTRRKGGNPDSLSTPRGSSEDIVKPSTSHAATSTYLLSNFCY